MCGCGAEDLPWDTCGSVDFGGPGEPKVDLPLSSLSESVVNSFEVSFLLSTCLKPQSLLRWLLISESSKKVWEVCDWIQR